MKNPITYLVLCLLVFLASIPPIYFFITNPSSDLWFIMILMAGFFGIYTLFIKTNWLVKFIAIISFTLCFFSSTPYVAFTSYVSIVLCCYLYILCTRIENWKVISNAFKTLLILNVFMVGMQTIGRDCLLNFGLGHDLVCFGVIGQHMQMGSFSVVLAAILLPFNTITLVFPLLVAFFCHSSWTILTAGAGIFTLALARNKRLAGAVLLVCLLIFSIYSVKHGKFEQNLSPDNGRLKIWEQSIGMANQHPLTGWGPGTYKILFPALCHNFIPYKTAHNAFVEMVFEMGYLFTGVIIFQLIRLMILLYEAKEIKCLAGLIMILLDASVHFPDRMAQTVGLIICFLAYCEVQLKSHRIIK